MSEDVEIIYCFQWNQLCCPPPKDEIRRVQVEVTANRILFHPAAVFSTMRLSTYISSRTAMGVYGMHQGCGNRRGLIVDIQPLLFNHTRAALRNWN